MSKERIIAERRRNFRDSIPGIKELEAARKEHAAFDEAYKLAMNYGIGKYPAEPESEFRAACADLSSAELVDALEDTIQGLQIVAPKAYAAAIRKLKASRN